MEVSCSTSTLYIRTLPPTISPLPSTPYVLHFVTVSPVLVKIIANCEQVKSLCLEESLMSDTQVFVALVVALIPGFLALRLSTELNK